MISCTFEHGNKASLRHVTVVAIVINHKNEFLLVKRAPYLSRGDKYTVPGGFLDRDEVVSKGMLRELQEESGLVGENYFLFRINSNPNRPNEDRQNVDFIYIVTKFTGELQFNKEVTDISWFTYEALPTKEDFAFDHRESIELYVEYLRRPFNLPIIN